MDKYHLLFELQGLPRTGNGSHGSWQADYGRKKKWKEQVSDTLLAHSKPITPLKKAKAILTRSSTMETDYDGLAHSFKPILDALVQNNILLDDRPSVLAVEYRWEKGKRGKGFIRVEVMEIGT